MGVKSLWGLMKVLFPESLAECTSGAQARAACGLLASSSTTSTSAPTSKAKPNSKPRARGTAAVHVAIDVNSFLHRASFSIGGGGGGDDSSTAAADKVVAAVRRKIDNILFARLESSDKSAGAAKLTVPGVSVKSLFIAVDGPPPLPKLLLQRSRRQETAKKRRTTTKALRFNSLNFTPGSLFMTRLDAALSHYAATIVARSPWIQEVIVRGSRDPGEGEVKIVKRIVTPIPTTKPTETHVHMIVTGDSDAIIQSNRP
ncbi:hypothetical protein BCR33DRAFT_38913 [Rhizoclosmatium globosum]|uniref:Xrn1 N-terminal domain-containing protein n=1 Tax=Rhizoclosmatium globosum TaxID=329046 RepID=A0A1Y2CP01_9FUNG|nr:hypothetical protein BCR33DRAFT_38913 [Rhizoclosmatium globosum]|eukprot:ORY48574.1 hypothetical protein BCR33DRAFT_38913 [Rhizoclosmatium globosum]